MEHFKSDCYKYKYPVFLYAPSPLTGDNHHSPITCFHYPITSPFPWFKSPFSCFFWSSISLSCNLSVDLLFGLSTTCHFVHYPVSIVFVMVGKGGTKTSCPWTYTTRRTTLSKNSRYNWADHPQYFWLVSCIEVG